ncbi:2286_t:CDS:10 [Entrophospora sp. SA101]|nr:2286_t:CDS:10 [Entrophospora sp. SA101]
MIDYRFGYEEEGELKQKGLFFSPNSSSILLTVGLLTKNQFPIFEYVSYDKIQDLYEQGKGHFYFIPDGFEPVLVPNDIKDQTVTNLLQSTKPVSTAPNVSRMLLDTDVRLPSYALPCTVNNNTDNDQDDNNQDKSTTTTTNAGATKKPPLSPSSLLLPDKKPPRPPNAFILYRRAKQPSILAKNNGGISNNDVSKEIGKMWHEEPEDIRLKYQKMAETAKQEHMKKYPEYRYKPRRPEEKKRRRSSKSSSQTQHENNGKGLLLGEGHEGDDNFRDPVPEHIKKAITHKVLSKQRIKNEKSNKDVDKFNKIDTTTIKDRNEKVSRIILNEENNNNNGNVDEAFIITKIKELTTLKKNLFQKLHGEHFQSQIFIGNKRSKEQSSPSFGPSFNKRSRTLSASTSNGISNSNSGNMMMGRARDDQYPYYHRNDYRPGHPPYIDHHIPYGRGFLNNNNMSRRQSNAAPPLPSGRSTIPRSLDRSLKIIDFGESKLDRQLRGTDTDRHRRFNNYHMVSKQYSWNVNNNPIGLYTEINKGRDLGFMELLVEILLKY